MAVESRLIWINGPFGGGKTSVARALVSQLADAALFDPEQIGVLLREILPVTPGDFQELPQWRDLWLRTVSTLIEHGSRVIVMPMTVCRREYVEEVTSGLRGTGATLHHIVLDPSAEALERRIEGDVTETPEAKPWRRAKVAEFMAARAWLLPEAELTIATDELAAADVAAAIIEQLGL